jgi:hypothetical protein
MHSALKRRFMSAPLQVHFGVVPNKTDQSHHRRCAFEVNLASGACFDQLLHTPSRLLYPQSPPLMSCTLQHKLDPQPFAQESDKSVERGAGAAAPPSFVVFCLSTFFSRQRSVPATRSPVQRLLRSPLSLRCNHLPTTTPEVIFTEVTRHRRSCLRTGLFEEVLDP